MVTILNKIKDLLRPVKAFNHNLTLNFKVQYH